MLLFAGVCSKSERKMSFEHFKQALSLMADKKYPGASNRLDKLTSLLLSGEGPKTHGATVSLNTLVRP